MTTRALTAGHALALTIGLLTAGGSIGPARAQDEDMGDLLSAGAIVFNDNCSACHGGDGKGTNNAPALDGNAFVESRSGVINQVISGNEEHGMPPFGDLLSDEEIAAVSTYVRNSWSNEYGIVFTRSVELRRVK